MRLSWNRWLLVGVVLCTLVSCAPSPAGSGASGGPAPAAPATPKKTTLTLGVSAVIDAFSYAQAGTTAGGGFSFYEMWLQGLVTSGIDNPAPEPRIAVAVPTLENGKVQLLADGRMDVTWNIRPDARWADGTDLLARDYVFGFDVVKDPQNPMVGVAQISGLYQSVDAVEALDDKTLVVHWRRPHYQFDQMGFALQPFPTHVLQTLWDQRNLDAFANHSYWRDDYFQVGPYRPTRFAPGEEIVLEPVATYFLGRPRLDRVIIRQYADQNTLLAAVLAGAVDVVPENGLRVEQAIQLKEQWERSGQGKVYVAPGGSNGVFPQFEPSLQAEPAMFESRFRQALMLAIDREAWTSKDLAGQVQSTAWSLLPPGDRLYEATKDSLRQYPFDQTRALRLFDELGWARGVDGMLANRSDGHKLRIEIRGGGDSASILQDYWKQVGIDAPQQQVPPQLRNDREYAQAYTGVEIAARGYGDQLLTRAECANSTTPPRFSGLNRGHYCNPRMDELITGYRASLTRPEQTRAIAEIATYHAQDLPVLQTYFSINAPAVVSGLNVLEFDYGGALQPSGFYGSYFRNSHRWEWIS